MMWTYPPKSNQIIFKKKSHYKGQIKAACEPDHYKKFSHIPLMNSNWRNFMHGKHVIPWKSLLSFSEPFRIRLKTISK